MLSQFSTLNYQFEKRNLIFGSQLSIINLKKIAIIGAGAAGCFCAANLKRMTPEADVHVFERGTKALAKVAITGGGRCNLTNSFRLIANLKDAYPRGDKLMRRALSAFSNEDTMRWFEREGVRLVTQDDECVFPVSQNAMEIVSTLLRIMQHEGVKLHLNSSITAVTKDGDGFSLTIGNSSEIHFDHVVVTTGGHPTPRGFSMLEPLELKIEQPVPSLFTFNIHRDSFNYKELMGTVVEDACVQLAGTKFRAHGPLLITHWGVSGPAILRLSSYAARHLAECGYKGTLIVNWCGESKEDEVRQMLLVMAKDNAQRFVTNEYPRHLTAKHWQDILCRSNIPATQRWGSINAKQLNKLTTTLTADVLQITGRCPFKEEFVTCGGVSLKEININTMEAKRFPGLYFAGEVLDVDAITGGFNLQAAWSMGYVIAQSIKSEE